MGGTDASVFAIEGVPTLGFTTEDFKGYDFGFTAKLAYGTGFIDKMEHPPEIPRTNTATVTAIIALGVANLDKQLSREGYIPKSRSARSLL